MKTVTIESLAISMGIAIAIGTGCGASNDRQVAGGPMGLVERCSGTYHCAAGSTTATVEIHRAADGTCRTGGADAGTLGPEVKPNGTLDTPSGGLTWKGDATQFTLCADDGSCVTCIDTAAGAGATGSTGSSQGGQSGKCAGSVDSCSSVGTTDCANQLGCSYDIGATFSEDDDSCGGSATDCDEIEDEKLCREQRGCHWQA